MVIYSGLASLKRHGFVIAIFVYRSTTRFLRNTFAGKFVSGWVCNELCKIPDRTTHPTFVNSQRLGRELPRVSVTVLNDRRLYINLTNILVCAYLL